MPHLDRFFILSLRSSTAVALVLSVLSAGPAAAQVVQTVSGAPAVSNASQIIAGRLSNVGASLETIVSGVSVLETVVAGGQVISSTVGGNVVSAVVDGNIATNALDLALASGSTLGSNAIIANTSVNSAFDAFGRIANATVEGIATAPASGSSIGVSGNAIAVDVDLNAATQTLQGRLNPDFANGDAGTSGSLSGAAGAATTVVGSADAGLLVTSVQVNVTGGVETPGNNTPVAADAFAAVSRTNAISVLVDGDYQSGLTIAADSNAISASFTGNDADNLIDVQAGFGAELRSAAGIVNVQNNQSLLAEDSALIAAGGARIRAVVDGPNTRVFEDGTLSFTGNAISASATGNLAENDLAVASGIDVDTPNNGTARNLVDADRSGAGGIDATAGLFTANLQVNALTSLSAVVDGTNTGGGDDNDLRVDVVEEMLRSTVDASRNAIGASAIGNDASGSITVAGANSLDGTVAAANLQIFRPSNGVGAAPVGVTAQVIAGDLQVDLIRTDVDITDSTVTVDDNAISAMAVANRDVLTVSLAASRITDQSFASPAQTAIDSTADADLAGADDLTIITDAGTSATSLQRIGDAGFRTAVSALAPDADIHLDIGNETLSGGVATDGTAMTGSSLSVDANRLSTIAVGGQQTLNVGIAADTSIDGSASVAVGQLGFGLDVVSRLGDGLGTGGAAIRADVLTSFGDAIGNALTLRDNQAVSEAVGQSTSARLAVAAGTSIIATGTIDTAATPFGANSLDLDLSGDGVVGETDDSITAAEMSVLSKQRLSDTTVAALTEIATVGGRLSTGINGVSDTTLAVDSNRIGAVARGNAAVNTLSFDAAAVDMSLADANGGAPQAAGTNLASLGAVQDLSGEIRARVTPEGFAQLEAFLTGSGAVTGSTVSLDANVVSAFASGNAAAAEMALSGSVLATDDIAQTFANLAGSGAFGGGDLEFSGVALATGVVQSSSADVLADIAPAGNFLLFSAIQTADGADVSQVALSADENVALAQARGLSATAATTLDFAVIESTALVGVIQDGSGRVAAAIGADAGTGAIGGAFTIAADTVASADLIGSVISASSNTAAAEATGANASAALSIEAESGIAAGSFGLFFGTTLERSPFFGFGVSSEATFGGVIRQNVAGDVAATGEDISIAVEAGDLFGTALVANGNRLSAGATGGASALAIDISAAEIAALDPARVAIAADQSLSAGVVEADLRAADVRVSFVDAADPSASTAIAEGNLISAAARGLVGVASLSAETASGIGGGGFASDSSMDSNGSSGGDLRMFVDADYASVTNQSVDAAVGASVDTASVALAQITSTASPAPAVASDSLSVTGNVISADARGGVAANAVALSTEGFLGGVQPVSVTVASNQSLTAAVSSETTDLAAGMSMIGSVTASTGRVASNRLSSSALGLEASNRLAALSGTGMSGLGGTALTFDAPSGEDILGRGDQKVLVRQVLDLAASVEAALARPSLYASAGDAVSNSTLAADGNAASAEAVGATAANAVQVVTSGTFFDLVSGGGPGIALGAAQSSEAAVRARVLGTDAQTVVALSLTGPASDSSLSVSSNTVIAAATGLRLDDGISVTTAGAAPDAADPAYVNVDTSSRGLEFGFADAGADRVVLSDQLLSEDADVLAEVLTDPTLLLAIDAAAGSSAIALSKNLLGAVATGAVARGSIDTSAGLSSSTEALVVTIQESDADVTGRIADGDLAVSVGTLTSSAIMAEANRILGNAVGLDASADVTVTAGGSIAGDADAVVSASIDAIGNLNVFPLVAFSNVTTVQRQAGSVSSEIAAGADAESSSVTIVTGTVTESAIVLRETVASAEAVGASSEARVRQSADGGILYDASAIGGSSASAVTAQQIGDPSAPVAATVSAFVEGLTMATETGDVFASTLLVEDNTALADARGAVATTSLDVSAGTRLEGDATGALQVDLSAGPAASSTGDADLISLQASSAAVAAVIAPRTPTSEEAPTIRLETGAVAGGATLAADTNRLAATAANLTARSAIRASAGGEADSFDVGLANAQTVTGDTRATVEGGAMQLEVGGAFDAVASISGNEIAASASGATATSGATLSASSILGAGVSGTTTSVSVDLVSASFDDVDDPSVVLGTIQSREATVSSQVADGAVGSAAGRTGIAAEFGGDAVGAVSMDGNRLASEANGLVATNSLDAIAENGLDGAGLSLVSVQTSGAGSATSAAFNPGSSSGDDDAVVTVRFDADVDGTVSLGGNAVIAAAAANTATNTLASAASGTLTAGAETAASVSATQDISVEAAGATAANAQRVTDATSATIDNVETSIRIGGAIQGTATIASNLTIAEARGNAATTTVLLDAGNQLAASAALVSTQSLEQTAAVSSGVDAAGGAGRFALEVSGDADGTAGVNRNAVAATAVANQALNSMGLQGARLAVATGGSAGGGAATADFTALNGQETAAPVTATLASQTLQADLGGAGASIRGSFAVDENIAIATAAGNLASNVFTLDAAGNARADFAFAGQQTNSGPIGARTSDVMIGMTAGAIAGGRFAVDGNRIGATAQGNVSAATLGGWSSRFSNR